MQRFARQHGLLIVSLAVIVVVLWLPVGLRSMPLIDDWWWHANMDAGRPMYIDTQPSRPLIVSAFAITYLLSPDSPVGRNVFLVIMLVAKGILLYAILRRFISDRLLVLLISTLAVVYAADTGVLYTIALPTYLTLNLYLLAVYLLVLYWKQRFWPLLALSLVCLIVQALIYEVAYPLVFLTPPLLLLLSRMQNSRRLILVTLVWYVVALIGFTFLLTSLSSGAALYQRGMLDTSNLSTRIVEGILYSLTANLWAGYADGMTVLRSVLGTPYAVSFLLLALVMGIGTAVLSLRLYPRPVRRTRRAAFALLIVGLIVIVAGYAMYIPTALHLSNTRTFYFSSVGGAMATIGAIYLFSGARLPVRLLFSLLVPLLLFLSPYSGGEQQLLVLLAILVLASFVPQKLAFTFVITLAFVFSTLSLLGQHYTYYQLGENQRRFLTDVMTQVPDVLPETTIVILPGELPANAHPLVHDPDPFILEGTLDAALEIVYHQASVDGRLCYTNMDACQFTDTALTVVVIDPLKPTEPNISVTPLENLIVFDLVDGRPVLLTELPPALTADSSRYDPQARIVGTEPAPRYYSYLGNPRP